MNKGRPINDRLSFRAVGLQRKFILEVQTKLNKCIAETAELINVHPRSLRDWKREKFRMSSTAAKKLSNISGVNIPKPYQIIKWKKHLSRAGIKGFKKIKRKYKVAGPRDFVNERNRINKWNEWWHKTGKHQHHPILNIPLPVHIPRKSKKLAEFTGIILGDGGITDLQIVITLDSHVDREFALYVCRTIKELFKIEPGIHFRADCQAVNIYISRKKLVNYFLNKLELKKGDKIRNQVDIPQWITANEEYYKACVRGLIDTDGCVIHHKYTVKRKEYKYRKLGFTSASLPLKMSVFHYLQSIGLKPRLSQPYDVRLDSKSDVKNYFDIVGSSNPKHLMRYKS